ncbi:MAG: TolC family protein [Ignavibacteria bacterium]
MKVVIIFLAIVFRLQVAIAQQTYDSLNILRLDYLIGNAISNNVKLRPVDIQKRIEIIKKDQVKQPTPIFEVMVDYIPLDFMAKPEYSSFLTQRLVFPVKLKTLEAVNNIRAKKQDIVKEQLKVELTRQVKDNYYNLYYYERLSQFNEEFQNIVKNIIKSLESNYSSGTGTQYQILKMYNELQMLELEKTDIESNKKAYVNNLKVITNLNLPDNFHTNGINEILESRYLLDTLALIAIMVKNNPEFKMIDNMIETSRIEKNLAEQEKLPDMMLSSGFRYMAKEPMSFVGLSIGIDLPFVPWNKKRINAMLEEKTTMELQALSLRQLLIDYMKNDLQSMLIMINTAKNKIDYLNESVIPQTRQTYYSTVVSYATSFTDFMSLLDSYRKLRETLQMLVKEETALLREYARLESLLGRQLEKQN